MYQPVEPLALWNLVASADEQYFSQPMTYFEDGRLYYYRGDGACVARCSIQLWLSEGDGSQKTHPIQCGQLAMLAPDASRYLCPYHWHCLWECTHCSVVLETDREPYCSPACERAYAEAEAAARALEEDA